MCTLAKNITQIIFFAFNLLLSYVHLATTNQTIILSKNVLSCRVLNSDAIPFGTL